MKNAPIHSAVMFSNEVKVTRVLSKFRITFKANEVTTKVSTFDCNKVRNSWIFSTFRSFQHFRITKMLYK